MKKFKYLIIIIFCLFLSCNNDDSIGNTLKWDNSADVSDYAMYVGGQPINTENLNIDSLVNIHFNTLYSSSLFENISIEFIDDLVVYVDSANKKQWVSPYVFTNDSLFLISDNKPSVFIGIGNFETIYRTKSLGYYTLFQNTKDSVFAQDDILTLDKLLAISGSTLNDIKSQTDTVIWCNVKYNFKKY